MARRGKTSPAEDIMDLVAMLPWWVGVVLALASYLLLHSVASQQVVATTQPSQVGAMVTQTLWKTLAGVGQYRRAGSALQVSPQLSAYALEAVADDLKVSAAWQAIDAKKHAWKARLPEQPGAWLEWLVGLPQAELIDLLALCTALTLNALANAVGLDMADWWEPSAQGYLNHVPKAQIVQALKEAGPDLAEDVLGAMKKDVLVVKATSRQAGKRWLPAPLRRPPD